MKTLAMKIKEESDTIFLAAHSFQALPHALLSLPHVWASRCESSGTPAFMLVRSANHFSSSSTAGTLTSAPAPSTCNPTPVSFPYFLKPFLDQREGLVCFPQKVNYSSNEPFITSGWMCGILSRDSTQNLVGESISPLRSEHIMKRGRSHRISKHSRNRSNIFGGPGSEIPHVFFLWMLLMLDHSKSPSQGSTSWWEKLQKCVAIVTVHLGYLSESSLASSSSPFPL